MIVKTEKTEAELKTPTMDDLLKAGAHLGHQTKRWHPAMRKYLAGKHNKSHVIDPRTSEESLRKAAQLVYRIVAGGGQMLLVGTKLHAKKVIEKEAKRGGLWYVNERWMGGTFTNFETIEERIKNLVKLEEEHIKSADTGGTKRNVIKTRTEIRRLNKFFGGVKEMDRLPDVVFIVDIKREEIAAKEAQITKIPCVAMVDSNCDPRKVDYPIPANDDSIRSIELVLSTLVDASIAGRKEFNNQLKQRMTLEVEMEESEAENSDKKADTKADADEQPKKSAKPASEAETVAKSEIKELKFDGAT